MPATAIDQILDKLVKDVEASVHSFYRGDVRRNTQRIRNDSVRNHARQQLLALVPGGGAAPESAAPSAGAALTREEIEAATRCVTAWLASGGASSASPGSRCIPAARELAPTWAERERALLALKRAAG